ncbi:hypothetical protein VA596_45720 [Amycolatopsis sp., V23-08]|uniref:Tetratricopeptide repeat protein n=1 Tax=Amycolatopsis heterodermiae TaxID=3110235 RepID=A0ABU5RKT1_9PSEU|nr:hypothetical protein [Amycolatopsis sp., V23-08]MEA5366898.1 hypothetical protein [Amycolatopsis sp., V23-08]
MEASKQHLTGPLSPQESGRSANAGGTLSAVGRLIERADALYLRAPELALVLGERAAALSEAAGADEQWIRAESLVVSARVRLGDRPATVGRAVAALRAAEHAGYGDIAARLRIDLAVCARSLGVPLTGLAALRPVLTDPVVSPVHRASALTHLVGCLAQIGRKSELDRVLVEADKLVLGDDSLGADTQLLVRALLRVGTAAHRRRHGDLTAAADAARTGLGFLEKLDNPADDGGLVRIRLVLLLVSTLLDRGDSEMAYEIAEPMLAEPVRAAGIAPASWLRLAVATRIHLPSGSGEAAIEMVREAVASTDRHGLAAVTARLWLELAQLHERFGQAEEAIACLYRSRAAEQLHARARRQACNVLAGEFGTGEPASIDLDEVLKAVPSRPVPVVAAEPAPAPVAPQPEPPRAAAPAWSFGNREGQAPAPAWSFEQPRVTADAAETSLMPAVRDEPAPPPARRPEPRVRPEPVAVERRPEPPAARPEPIEVRSEQPGFRPEPIEVRSDRPAESGYRQEPVEVRSADPGYRSEPVEARSERPAEGRAERSAERGYRSEPAEVRSEQPGHRSEPVNARSERPAEPAYRPESIEARSERMAAPGRRQEPAEQPGYRPEPVEARPQPPADTRPGRRAAPEPRLDPIEVRSTPERRPDPADPPWRRTGLEPRPEPIEIRAERRPEPDFRPEPDESPAERRAEPAGNGKAKFSWAAVAEARLRETAAERESAPTRITPALPLAPEPAAEREPERREPQPSTRHDSEHGSQSVLDRLGISASGGGGGRGRRRAEDADSPREEPAPARPKEELAPAPRPEDYSDDAEPWLPRLRMPPSLEPMEDFGNWTPATAPFPESYARAISEDEPPPDAGLADLLARALAEHQAGTASAAALVKQLGSQDNGSRRNGHGRNGHGAEVGDSRRHGSSD